MKLSLYISAILLSATLFQGCGGETESNDSGGTTVPTEKKDTVIDTGPSSLEFFGDFSLEFLTPSFSWTDLSLDDISNMVDDLYNYVSNFVSGVWNDADEVDAEEILNNRLINLVNTSVDVDDFVQKGMKITVEYVVNEYFFIANDYFLVDKDWGKKDDQFLYQSLIESSVTLVSYFKDFYKETKSENIPSRVVSIRTDSRTLIEKIIDEVYNILAKLISDFFSFENDIVPVDTKYRGMRIDPNQSFSFTMSDLEDAKYYVASEQYMTVTFEKDGLSGYGDIGYGVGASFTSGISSDKLFIDMKGVYEVEMIYKDPGYCYATEMTNTSDGSKYPAYFFLDKTVYDKASNISSAKSLCYLHSTEYKAKVVAVDGNLEPIQDIRVNHAPIAKSSTSTMVDVLVSGIDNTASITDSKYFARKMRHGVFAIYTTNEQTHTLQATESEKVSRELLPLAASSAIGIEELLTGAYDSSTAFQKEVNSALSRPTSEINDRISALITATSQAMDRTTSDTNYHGISDTTSFGDIVEFNTDIKKLSLFRNEATADVTITIKNPTTNGIEADVTFITEVKTTVLGDSEVKFTDIDATSGSSYLSGVDYRLHIASLNYHRSTGEMNVHGDGYIGNTSRLAFDTYTVKANFTESPTIALLELKVTADGTITTVSGRNFDGVLVFDGYNTSNSYMDGVLIGIDKEPKIEGIIKTSLSSDDITNWVDEHEKVLLSDAGDLDSIGSQSYSMDVKITKDKKSVSADMLVKRDDSAETWTYIMNNLVVSDANINLSATSVYLIQRGNNTLVETLKKMAINGVSVDSDINTLVNIGWNIASDFNNIGIEGLQVTMNPASGDVSIKTTIHVSNRDETMNADMNATYDYATTHLSSIGVFSTIVDASGTENSYDNTFTTAGIIKVDNKYDYTYSISYTDSIQDMLFTSTDSSYQMGFRLTDTSIVGGDSYGVLATFIMNKTYTILENMRLVNDDENPLGIYNRSEDNLKIKFSDGVEEYMYLY